eukprot:1176401-Rhodomonas_salina.3
MSGGVLCDARDAGAGDRWTRLRSSAACARCLPDTQSSDSDDEGARVLQRPILIFGRGGVRLEGGRE